MKYLSIFILLSFCVASCDSESIQDISEQNDLTGLKKQVLEMDSLLFTLGFNQIDTQQVSRLIADDFEFYHDEHGVMASKEEFLNSISGLEDLPFKTWRVLKDGTTEIFPMYKENRSVLYGIIQTGVHQFYQQKEGEKARLSGTARFNHLWVLENDKWVLKRVLSYDHQNQ